MIRAGDTIPDVPVATMGPDGPETVQTGALFAGRKVALFAVPGAFTPTCSIAHLPGFRDSRDQLAALGIELVCCISVNDVFVMDAWAKQQNLSGEIMMLADGSAAFAEATGLLFDGKAYHMGLRSKRYAMLIEDGVVRVLNVEADGAFEVSSAEALMAAVATPVPAGA